MSHESDSDELTPAVKAFIVDQMTSVFFTVAEKANEFAKEYRRNGDDRGAQALEVFALAIQANTSRWRKRD